MLIHVLDWLDRVQTLISSVASILVIAYVIREWRDSRKRQFFKTIQATINHLWETGDSVSGLKIIRLITRACGKPDTKTALEDPDLVKHVIKAARAMPADKSVLLVPVAILDRLTSVVTQWVGSIYAEEFIKAAIRGQAPNETLLYAFLSFEQTGNVSRVRLQLVCPKFIDNGEVVTSPVLPLVENATTLGRIETLKELSGYRFNLVNSRPIPPDGNGNVPVIARVWVPSPAPKKT